MNSPFDFFDKIYCINLAERTDRWEQCLKNFEKYDIKNYERVEAVKIEDNRLDRKRKGQIGCALSFVKCFNLSAKNGYEKVLFLEDDFNFAFNKDELFDKMNRCLEQLPNDWDSLFFGGTLVGDYGHFPIKRYSEDLFKLLSTHCTHCIAFSKSGVNKVINMLGGPDIWSFNLVSSYEAIDIFFAKDYQRNTNSFFSDPIVCYQTISESNIESVAYDYSAWMDRNFKFFKRNLI